MEHRLIGRLVLVLAVCILGPACVGGEISGSSGGGARFAPDTNNPEISDDTGDPAVEGAESPLVCAEASADVSASRGWQSSEVSEPASGALSFSFKARPTAAALDGVVAVGAQRIDTFSEAAILVRFAEDGFVDARDGGIYDSDVNYPYDPGVWYDVDVTADVQTKTYDVEIGRCGEPKQALIENASFRDSASVGDWLSGWGVWSSQSAALEISTPAWRASGGCAPATCETLGHTCGQPSDGCGGVLSCGTCGAGETCTSGTCVDASVPPPPCEPATCQTLNAECGLQSDGCGGTLSCGGCSVGEMCSGGGCVEEPAPPPPTCTAATCQSLGAECGVHSDGCGGTLSCGGCSAGETCGGTGQCVVSSGAWWETVLKPDGANTGPNCTGRAGCPNATLRASNAPPLVVTQDGATYENFTMTLGQYDEISIQARNVTFRNFYIQGNSWTTVKVQNTENANFLMEYGEIVGGSPCSQLLEGDGTTVRYSKFHNCDDIWKINDSHGSNGPVTIEDSYFYDALGGHGDTFMIWPNMDNDTTARHNHFVGGNTSIVIDASISPGATLLFEENWLHAGGAAYTIYCDTREGGARVYRDNLFDRNYQYGPVADPGCTWLDNAYMDDASPVPYAP